MLAHSWSNVVRTITGASGTRKLERGQNMKKYAVEAQVGNLFNVLKQHVGQYINRGASIGHFLSVKPLAWAMALLLVVCGIASTSGQ
ncbi:MAG: hypothetical protein HW416_2252, partial [Chloroflexi bacterium]|nr:hypothetical protein [Chloroflexota bacterium]